LAAVSSRQAAVWFRVVLSLPAAVWLAAVWWWSPAAAVWLAAESSQQAAVW
jgi:hypothetical protein